MFNVYAGNALRSLHGGLSFHARRLVPLFTGFWRANLFVFACFYECERASSTREDSDILIEHCTLFESHFVSGLLQMVGCWGALRLSEKLLNAYWLLLLLLLLGDALLGIFWMFKFEKIMQGLQPMLR